MLFSAINRILIFGATFLITISVLAGSEATCKAGNHTWKYYCCINENASDWPIEWLWHEHWYSQPCPDNTSQADSNVCEDQTHETGSQQSSLGADCRSRGNGTGQFDVSQDASRKTLQKKSK